MQFLGILQDVEEISTEVPKMKLYKLPGGTETLKTWDLIEDVPTTPSAPFVSLNNSFRILIVVRHSVHNKTEGRQDSRSTRRIRRYSTQSRQEIWLRSRAWDRTYEI